MRLLLFTFFSFSFAFQSCDKLKLSKKTDSDLLDKVSFIWKVNIAKEDGYTVYDENTSQYIKGYYSTFLIDLSSPPKVKLTDIDGLTFEGLFSLDENSKQLLIQFNNEAPYGTNGKISYSMELIDDDNLVLIRNSTNPKTGVTITTYNLVKK